jgi:TonB family protein
MLLGVMLLSCSVASAQRPRRTRTIVATNDIPPVVKGCSIDYAPTLSLEKWITQRPKLIYPEEAKARNISGAVFVWVKIDEEGKVISSMIISGPPLLQDAALRAVSEMRFSLTKIDGRPIKVGGRVRIDFTM